MGEIKMEIKMETKSQKKRSIDLQSIDLQTIVTPIALIVVISALTALFPQGSERVIMNLRNFSYFPARCFISGCRPVYFPACCLYRGFQVWKYQAWKPG
jgi:hypothetical protein